jgi:hypothetical protein
MNLPDTPDVPVKKARRPISLWLLLAVAWGFGAFFVAGVFKHLFEAVMGDSAMRSLINAAILIIVASYFVGLAIAILRRKSWAARTLGTFLLVFGALLAFFGPGQPAPGCVGDCVQDWWLGRLLAALLMIGWAVTAGWSPGAKRYYLAGSSGAA